MLEEDTRQNLLKALEGLQKELDEKTTKILELETIRGEYERIKILIQLIKEELGLEVPKSILEIKSGGGMIISGEGLVSFITPKPIAEGASEIFDEFKRPITIKEIVNEFRRRGWKLSENNPQEVIRSTLKRHPKLFKKVSRGNWKKIQRIAQVGSPPSQGGEVE
ncbi:MAG: HTH domain-containing protein [Thermodesulfobacteriota bacterium]